MLIKTREVDIFAADAEIYKFTFVRPVGEDGYVLYVGRAQDYIGVNGLGKDFSRGGKHQSLVNRSNSAGSVLSDRTINVATSVFEALMLSRVGDASKHALILKSDGRGGVEDDSFNTGVREIQLFIELKRVATIAGSTARLPGVSIPHGLALNVNCLTDDVWNLTFNAYSRSVLLSFLSSF